jgi:hypothetical protein
MKKPKMKRIPMNAEMAAILLGLTERDLESARPIEQQGPPIKRVPPTARLAKGGRG